MLANVSATSPAEHKKLLGSGRDWTRAFWVEDASVTSILQCLTYESSSNSTFIKSIRLLLQDPKNDQSGYKSFALFLGLIWNFRLVRTPSHWESPKNRSLWDIFALFLWSKISYFSIAAMGFQIFRALRTIDKLEPSMTSSFLVLAGNDENSNYTWGW